MIEKIKYLFAGALALSSVALIGCNDDDNTEFDEFDATFVYIARPLLGVHGVEFTVAHEADGIIVGSGVSIESPVTVRLSKPMETDVTVTLGTKLEGFPEDAFSFRDGGIHVIPAGELEVNDALVFSNDWSFAIETKPATTYKATITIADVQPQQGDLLISKNQGSLFLTVNKNQYFSSNIIPNKQPTGVSLEPRSGWTVMWTPKEDETGWEVTTNVTDGNAYSYANNNTGPIAISIDLGAVHTMTGLMNDGYSSSYAHNNCVILSSNDGVQWKRESDELQKDVVTKGNYQYLSFKKPITARYIRWKMWSNNTSNRCRSAEVYVYVQD